MVLSSPPSYLFCFEGVIEYLEDLMTRIDDDMQIAFFNQIDFDTPQHAQFINRTPNLMLMNHDATILFYDDSATVVLSPGALRIAISCREPNWQLSSIEQICNSFWYTRSTAEVLYIKHQYSELVWKKPSRTVYGCNSYFHLPR